MLRNVLPAATADEWDAETWAVAQVRSSSAPALVAHHDGSLIAHNAAAAPLMESGGAASSLRALIADASRRDRSQLVRLTLRADTDHAGRFDLTLMPLPYRNVLVIARDVTAETNLTEALVASRALFRDLALCATDFAFETDADGVFTWVSPNGVLGYSAVELHGGAAARVFADNAGLLSSRAPIEAAEVWCEAKAGTERCVEATIVPVSGPDGAWRGVRGVVRDVTALRLHEREALRARRRDELIGAVVTAMRAQIEPRRMMLAAADALLGATGSQRVAVRPTCSALSVSVGDVAAGVEGGLIAATSYQGRTNGSLCLSRNAGEKPYGDDEQLLLDAVVPHLGVAIALAELVQARAEPSREDGLTGLLNREGFEREARARLGAFARAGRSCALFVLGCDGLGQHWKKNDLFAAVGRLLSREAGQGEVTAHIRDDQFALLAPAPSDESVAQRAEKLSASFAALCEELGLACEVFPSLGVAFVEPEAGEPFEEILSRAEAAQRQGSRVAIAEPSKKVKSC